MYYVHKHGDNSSRVYQSHSQVHPIEVNMNQYILLIQQFTYHYAKQLLTYRLNIYCVCFIYVK